ncbi:hypothetical protein KY314_02900 [Candidatus Woesearchaeota archaeon]|nr:hypothetical protein [Candidatus Woesearchaeota archaeon]
METNKTVFFIMLIIIAVLSFGNMWQCYHVENQAIRIIENQAPPMTLSKAQTDSLKKAFKQ